MTGTTRIAVVIGSSRPGRISGGIAEWVRDRLAQGSEVGYEIVDLAEVGLPMLDESLPAATQQYEHEHTRAWSRTVSGFDGFVFVFPQYNWGYPAVLKNALDYLYREWAGKPVSFVTFGTHGGSRAAEQITTVFAGLHMQQLEHHVRAVITRADLGPDWQLIDVDATLRPIAPVLALLDAEFAALPADRDDAAATSA